MRGRITFASDTPAKAVDVFLHDLREELLRLRPAALDAQASEITVRGGIFRLVPSWNLLIPITSASIRATSNAHEVLVAYDVRLTQIVRICTFLSLAFLIFLGVSAALAGSETQMNVAVALVLGTQFFVWGLLFGVNYIETRFRFGRMLRRIARGID